MLLKCRKHQYLALPGVLLCMGDVSLHLPTLFSLEGRSQGDKTRIVCPHGSNDLFNSYPKTKVRGSWLVRNFLASTITLSMRKPKLCRNETFAFGPRNKTKHCLPPSISQFHLHYCTWARTRAELKKKEPKKELNMLGQQRREEATNEESLGFNTHLSPLEGEKASAHLSFYIACFQKKKGWQDNQMLLAGGI